MWGSGFMDFLGYGRSMKAAAMMAVGNNAARNNLRGEIPSSPNCD